jgi:hypothetical protein
MSYEYNVNESAPFEVRITGPYYNTLFPFNPTTNEPFVSREVATEFAVAQVALLENPPRYEIWYHMSVTGGDGKVPVGIRNDGIDSLLVTITARETEDPTSPIRPITDNFRVDIKTQDGSVYDVVLVAFVNGVGTINYTDDNKKGNNLMVTIPDNLKVMVNEDGSVSVVTRGVIPTGNIYSVYLIGSTHFVVYRVI